MDKQLHKGFWQRNRKYFLLATGVLVLAYVVLLGRTMGNSLSLPKEKLSIVEVKKDDFAEYIAVDGVVIPLETVYLDAVEGGVVESIKAEDGKMVKEGEELLILTNGNLQLDYVNRETQILELLNQIENMRISSQQSHTREQKELADLKYNLQQSERKYKTNKLLASNEALSKNDMQASEDEQAYLREKEKLTRKALIQDSILIKGQLRQMSFSAGRMQDNLKMVKKNLDNLVVKAPINGQLTSFDLKKGQLVQKGQSLGQIDVQEGFKVRVQIDEHYIARIVAGQTGSIEFDGKTYTLMVNRINPQVKNGFFAADMVFQGQAPANIRKGQNLSVKLQLSAQSKALMVEKGGFSQQTGGNWIFVLSTDGKHAIKTHIKMGRQNPQYFELLEGVKEGEKVIVSSYAGFEDKDKLTLE